MQIRLLAANIREQLLRALLAIPRMVPLVIPAHGNIRARILRALLGVSFLSMLCFTVISLQGISELGDFAVKSSNDLGAQTSKISKTALEQLTTESLLRITVDQASLCNSEFEEIEATVNVLADLAQKQWQRPGTFPGNRSFAVNRRPRDLRDASVYQYPRGVDVRRIREDVEISSAMDTFFRPILASNANISDFNIGTPNGLFRRFPWGPVAADYDVRKREWFKGALQRGTGGWSDPYLGVIAKNLRINYAKPVFVGKTVKAVVAINVPLRTVNERIISMRLNNQGSALLVDRQRKIIAREGMPVDGEKWADPQQVEIFELDAGTGSHRELEEDLLAARKGITRGIYKGKEYYIAHAPLQTTRWSLIFIMPVEVINATVIPAEKAISGVTSQVTARIRTTMLDLTEVFFAAIAAVYLLAWSVARFITEPIMILDAGAKVIGDGNLEHRIEVHTGDEIEALAETFNRMTDNLREYIRNLTETTAAKERIQGELNVATDIQGSLLPRLFPPFPTRKEFDIFARMDPAKEVGGDFYDFFFVNDKTLCFLVADVSDKGVPAALYMMVAKTLLKTEALRGLGPDEILSSVNKLLADNDSCMFVTVFCALLDTDSGEVLFANAGHNPPLIYRSGQRFEYLKIQAGFVLGPIPDTSYRTETLTLAQGDVLFLYTDGVTEAQNQAAELYGEKRLLEALNRGEVGDLNTMVQAIRSEVEQHADGAPQSDDVTMLALRFRGNSGDG
ncbi:SpoIIE family protein phosphatase [Geomonas sp.]|uniref:SpoIIE family protein phosphatase n=1 Tax=Geomonas sp. TaxID=2651584 RepID=UPI002B4A66BA|nr:SpoIIE family protein phosphatase [Geomonas sp.]HJV34570.1 SpoIIE family protein phosphatase [Geomonas sp.]